MPSTCRDRGRDGLDGAVSQRRDADPDVRTKATTLLESIVDNHALVDGNKRLGWLSTAVFLELNGADITGISNHDVDDLP